MRTFILLVFVFSSNFLFSQTQLGQDLLGVSPGDFFGQTLAISDDGYRVAISAPTSDDTINNVGHIRIFEYNESEWLQLGDSITGIDYKDKLGTSLCISGDGSRIAAGAFDDGVGYVRVFQWSNTEWTQVGTEIYGTGNTDLFGFSVSLSYDGNKLAVGAPRNDDAGNWAGQAILYQEVNGSWVPLGEPINGENEGDEFGYSVSLNAVAERLAIGGRFNDDNGQSAGHVRIFDVGNGTNWSQIGAAIEGQEPGAWFGRALSLSSEGTRLVVGTNRGHVQVFKEANSLWQQMGADIIEEEVNDNSFGQSVEISGDGQVVAISAPENELNGFKAGMVRCFRLDGENWTALPETVLGTSAGDQCGYAGSVSLSFDGTVMAVGSIFNDDNGEDTGMARMYGTHYVSSTDDLALINSLSVFPNPSNGYFIVELEKHELDAHNILVTDQLGKQVDVQITSLFEGLEIYISTPGVYFLNFPNTPELRTQKLLVLR